MLCCLKTENMCLNLRIKRIKILGMLDGLRPLRKIVNKESLNEIL